MRTFQRITSRIAPLPADNIDTDQIIPANYLKVTDKKGLGEGLFANWRYLANGQPDPDFVLNRPAHRDARILLAGDNFGCGSSREHAAWALQEHGFEVVISTGFADIFRSNAAKNGLLTAVVSRPDHATLLRLAQESSSREITVDLETRIVTCPGLEPIPFEVDPFARYCLLNGLDQLGFLLHRLEKIAAWEARHPQPVDTVAGGSGDQP
jgi:3-isopropylmalate/(R)-2-methylmalate dehydratase small subunit